MMKKESFRRILIRIFWISLVFTIGFSWVYIRYAVPDRLNLVVNEEEVFHFALPPGVTFESDSEEVVLKNASARNDPDRTPGFSLYVWEK